MTDAVENGEWFLPNSNCKFPGRLFFDKVENKIILETFGDRYLSGEPIIIVDPERDKKYNSKNFNNSHQRNFNLIHGTSRNNITLFSCHWYGLEDIGKELYSIRYEAKFAFFNIHIDTVADLKIKTATLQFPFLSSWYDGWKLNDKLEDFEEKYPKFSGSKRTLAEVTPIHIDQRLVIYIYDVFVKRMEVFGVHHALKYHKHLQFQYSGFVSWEQFLNDLSIFKKLLEFSHGKHLVHKLLSIQIENDSIKNSEFQEAYYNDTAVGNFSFHNGEDVDKHFQHQRYMLLSKWLMDDTDVNELIKKWFDNKTFYPIYDFYIDSNNWFKGSTATLSNIMFNNRFLNMIQGLESYYLRVLKPTVNNNSELEKKRIIFEKNKKSVLSKIEDAALKEWCNSNLKFVNKNFRQPNLEVILSDVLQSLDDIIQPIFGAQDLIKYFPKFASKIRNDLSHGVNEKTSQGDILHYLFKLGQIFLAICILKTLEIKDIKDKIVHYDAFERAIYEIKMTKLVIK